MYTKCPICGLNYITANDTMCAICYKEKHSGLVKDELCEICGKALQYNEYEICGECLSNKL